MIDKLRQQIKANWKKAGLTTMELLVLIAVVIGSVSVAAVMISSKMESMNEKVDEALTAVQSQITK